MKTDPIIKFNNQEYILLGTLEEGGAIATREQWENGLCSFAHLFEDGKIMRFGEEIGSREDIQVIGKYTDNSKPNALLGILFDQSWPFNRI